MERIGVRELRQNASRYLGRVKQGETIEVTERGVPIAVLGPVPAKKPALLDRLIAEGKAIPAKGSLIEWLEENPPLPSDPDCTGPTMAEILDESREDIV